MVYIYMPNSGGAIVYIKNLLLKVGFFHDIDLLSLEKGYGSVCKLCSVCFVSAIANPSV